MQPDILCLGEPLLEFNQVKSAASQGQYLQGFGGDTSNAAIAAARQGAKVGYITAIGYDTFGDDFINLWKREGVDTSSVIRSTSAHTGIYFVSHSDKGHAFNYFRAGSAASLMTPADLPGNAISHAKILHVSGISQAISNSACDAVFAAMDIARAAGVQISYDTNLRLKLWSLDRARAVIHDAIARADIALPSYEDAEQLTGLKAPDAIADFYLRLGVPLVVLKLGSQGVLIATENERTLVKGHVVNSVDATGAGDTFGGSFLARIVEGDAPVTAATYANAAAALSTQGYGAVDPIPTAAMVEDLLSSLNI